MFGCKYSDNYSRVSESMFLNSFTKSSTSKLCPQVAGAILIIYSPGKGEYKLLDILARKAVIFRDMQFDELGVASETSISWLEVDKERDNSADLMLDKTDDSITKNLIEELQGSNVYFWGEEAEGNSI